jgi:hypothetical protein
VISLFQIGSDPSRADPPDIDCGAYFQAVSRQTGLVTAAWLIAMGEFTLL